MHKIPNAKIPSTLDTKKAETAIKEALIIYKIATITAKYFMFSRSFCDISISILTQKTRKEYAI